MAASRQGSRESADQVAAGSSATATKRPKTSKYIGLDSEEPQAQDLYELDSDAEEAMMTEAMLVDDEDIWGAESLDDYGMRMAGGGSGSISDVELNDDEDD